LALGRQEPLAREAGNGQVEGLAPQPVALGLHGLDDELQVASSGPHGDLAERGELHAVVRGSRDAALVACPYYAPDLRVLVTKAEIPVSVAVRLEVRHFAAHPQREECALQYVLDGLRERCNAHRARGAAAWRFVP